MFSKSSKTKLSDERSREREEERILIERCKNNEEGAWDELVSRFEKRVFNFAYRITGRYDEAEDIAQEAFIRVFNSIQTFRGDAVFTTWIYRIITNVYLDERKRSKSHRQISLDDNIELEENSVARQFEDEGPKPADIVENKERDSAVQRAINSLPDHQKIIVTLYHIQDLSYEEIAEILRHPIGTVKSRLNRARLALKEKLETEPELFG